jgi:sugar O-acyltransferase (sialic acid O-acetyltransferase NeuD family)
VSNPGSRSLWIVGGGAQGRVVLDAWRCQRPECTVAFLDDDRALWGSQIAGATVAGGAALLDAERGEALLAIGHNGARRALAERLSSTMSAQWGTLVHPTAFVSSTATVAPGAVILAGALVNTDARIERHAIVNTGAIVEHDCTIEAFASISPGVRMGGRVVVGAGAFVSAGVTLCPRVRVGAGSVVGAGAVVTKDLPEGVLAFGVPARVVRGLSADDWRRLL